MTLKIKDEIPEGGGLVKKDFREKDTAGATGSERKEKSLENFKGKKRGFLADTGKEKKKI